uniref:Transposase n=1 Tax=Streptomyces sp. NBC_00180 TaxID=2903632 RepID=A0AAU1ICL9_9ACTN
MVFVHLAISIGLGARSVLEAEQLGLHQQRLFGPAASDSTVRRLPADFDEDMFAALSRARAAVRRVVWTWLSLRPQGFPWLTVAGKHLQRWVVVDIDATIITSASKKEGAAPTFKRGFGFHPLAAWCANTQECLAMHLRAGNAGSNTAEDHIAVLTESLHQIPASSRAKILVRVDGAGATHDLHEHLQKLNTMRRRVRFTTVWKITGTDETAIARIPETAWENSLQQDGSPHDTDHSVVAEPTGLNQREGWITGMRLIVRRVRPLRPAPGEPHRLREEDRLEVLGHRHQHHQTVGPPGITPGLVDRRSAPAPRGR